MDVKEFKETKKLLCKLLSEKALLTKENMVSAGIQPAWISEMQLKHIFGRGNDQGVIFVNWHTNKFYPDATLDTYKPDLSANLLQEVEKLKGTLEKLAEDYEVDYDFILGLLH